MKEQNPAHCNTAAWEGALDGFANTVLVAANLAVQLMPHGDNFLDTRAVVRAFAGDLTGAAEDFQRVIDLAKAFDSERERAWVAKRERWLAALKSGKVPFTAAELRKTAD